jgi:hypothetical protein
MSTIITTTRQPELFITKLLLYYTFQTRHQANPGERAIAAHYAIRSRCRFKP